MQPEHNENTQMLRILLEATVGEKEMYLLTLQWIFEEKKTLRSQTIAQQEKCVDTRTQPNSKLDYTQRRPRLRSTFSILRNPNETPANVVAVAHTPSLGPGGPAEQRLFCGHVI